MPKIVDIDEDGSLSIYKRGLPDEHKKKSVVSVDEINSTNNKNVDDLIEENQSLALRVQNALLKQALSMLEAGIKFEDMNTSMKNIIINACNHTTKPFYNGKDNTVKIPKIFVSQPVPAAQLVMSEEIFSGEDDVNEG